VARLKRRLSYTGQQGVSICVGGAQHDACDLHFSTTALSATTEAVCNLLLAAVLGAIIGAEREYHGRSAGLRTQLLVALGSCLAMIVSLHFATVYGAESSNASLRVDPARVAYGIMSGIGFLGAGRLSATALAFAG